MSHLDPSGLESGVEEGPKHCVCVRSRASRDGRSRHRAHHHGQRPQQQSRIVAVDDYCSGSDRGARTETLLVSTESDRSHLN